MFGSPDSFWGTDLLEQEITPEEEAQQVLLFELQARPELSENTLQERFIESRTPDQIHIRLAGKNAVTILFDTDSPEEASWLEYACVVHSDVTSPLLNAMPLHHRRALASLLRTEEDEDIQRIVSILEETQLLTISKEEMVMNMQVLQAECVAAVLLGELQPTER